jgi:hypothetical protein
VRRSVATVPSKSFDAIRRKGVMPRKGNCALELRGGQFRMWAATRKARREKVKVKGKK